MKSNVWLVIMLITAWSFDGMAADTRIRSRRILPYDTQQTTVAQAASSSQNRRISAPLRNDTTTGTGTGTGTTASTGGAGTAAAPAPTSTSQSPGATPRTAPCNSDERILRNNDGNFIGCEPLPAKERSEKRAIDRACGVNFEREGSDECKALMKTMGLNPCAASDKEARDALSKFNQACADAGYTDGRSCMKEAYQCSKDMARETESTDKSEDLDFMKFLGMNSADISALKGRSKVRKCSLYGMKDYQTEKRERNRTLRSVKKDMEELQKDQAQEKKDAASKKSQLQKDYVQVQTELRESMTAEQKQQSEEGMNIQKQMAEIDDQKSNLRAEIYTIRADAASIIGERAMKLAELTDAMIATQCTQMLEKLIASWKVGVLQGGLSAQSMQTAEKKRRLEAEKTACYAKAEALRTATYNTYRAKLDATENRALEQERRIKALDNQKTQLVASNTQALQRASEAQRAANSEAAQKQYAIQMEMAQFEAAQVEKDQATKKQLLQAQDELNSAISDIDDLGKPPKGLKTPTEAAAAFSTLSTAIKSINEVQCEEELKKLKTTLKDNNLIHYYDHGLTRHPDDPEEDDESEGTP